MPEYSSTTITPADGVQVPSMNGSTSGNFLLSALKSYILAEKGQANGLASLGSDGKLPAAQLPDLADDVIVVASYAVLPAAGTAGKIYITADNNKLYRWDPDLETPDYVELSVDLSAYATKAELAEEESAREAADSNLLSAIRKDEARITNLEEKADPTGAYKTVNYRGTNDVPPNKAKYALVESIVGKSRAWNQRINGGDFSDATLFDMVYSSLSVSDNVGTITLLSDTSSAARISKPASETSLMEDHKVLASIKIKSPKDVNCGFYIGAYWSDSVAVSANSWQTITLIMTVGNSGYDCAFGFNRNTRLAIGDTVQVKEFFVRDLTLIFPEGVPSTVAECVAKCPDILTYDAYGTSIVDTTVEGVKSVGVNIFDGLTELGDLNNGVEVPASNRIRAVNYCDVEPSTGYYILSVNNATVNVAYFDANKNFISDESKKGKITTPSGCYYIRIWFPPNYGTTYQDDIQMTLDNYADKTTYHPYMTDTLTLPSPVTLKGAYQTGDILDLSTGIVTRTSDEITITGNETYIQSGAVPNFFMLYDNYNNAMLARFDIGVTGEWKVPLLNHTFVGREYESSTTLADSSADVFGSSNGKAIGFKADASITTLEGFTDLLKDLYNNDNPVKIRLPLVTPSSSPVIDPVIDNTILTEGGGTINTIQTQTPVIDNSMDVGYLAL